MTIVQNMAAVCVALAVAGHVSCVTRTQSSERRCARLDEQLVALGQTPLGLCPSPCSRADADGSVSVAYRFIIEAGVGEARRLNVLLLCGNVGLATIAGSNAPTMRYDLIASAATQKGDPATLTGESVKSGRRRLSEEEVVGWLELMAGSEIWMLPPLARLPTRDDGRVRMVYDSRYIFERWYGKGDYRRVIRYPGLSLVGDVIGHRVLAEIDATVSNAGKGSGRD